MLTKFKSLKLLSLCVACAALLMLSIKINAEEPDNPEIFISGSITVNDPQNTNQAFIAEFTDLLPVGEAEKENKKKTFEYLPENKGKENTFALSANTVYSAVFYFLNSSDSNTDGQYEVVNANGTEIEPVSTTGMFFELSWIIRKKNEIPGITEKTESGDANLATDDLTEKINPEVGYSLLDDFIKQTGYFTENVEYTKEYGVFDLLSSISLKNKYIEEGYSEAEWNSMTLYEQVLWELLYFDPKEILRVWDFKDEDEFLNSLRGLGFYKAHFKYYPDGNIFADALKPIWSWHWDNYQEYDTFINILDKGIPDPPAAYTTTQDKTDITEETQTPVNENISDIEETTEAVSEQPLEENTEPEDNVFVEIIKNHLFTIILVLVVAIVFAAVFIRKKYFEK